MRSPRRKQPFVTDGGEIVWRFSPVPVNEDVEDFVKVAGAVLLGAFITVTGMTILACINIADRIRKARGRVAEWWALRWHERNSE